MNEVTKLKSGSELTLIEAPFEEASALMESLVNELKAVNVDIGNLGEYLAQDGDVQQLIADPKIVNTFKNTVCQLLGSKTFKAALMTCMGRCMLNGDRITLKSFEAARGDYLPTAWEVARFNLVPFFAGLDLSSLTSTAQTKSSQAS